MERVWPISKTTGDCEVSCLDGVDHYRRFIFGSREAIPSGISLLLYSVLITLILILLIEDEPISDKDLPPDGGVIRVRVKWARSFRHADAPNLDDVGPSYTILKEQKVPGIHKAFLSNLSEPPSLHS